MSTENPLRDAELRRQAEVTKHRFDEALYACDWCECFVPDGEGLYPEDDPNENLRFCRACYEQYVGASGSLDPE